MNLICNRQYISLFINKDIKRLTNENIILLLTIIILQFQIYFIFGFTKFPTNNGVFFRVSTKYVGLSTLNSLGLGGSSIEIDRRTLITPKNKIEFFFI